MNDLKGLNICFLVGSLAISGGTYVILQHASFLKKCGASVTLAVQEPFRRSGLNWHDELQQLNCMAIEEARLRTYDLVIATWWKTALELHRFSAPRYGYFVQSIESRFYPEEEVPLRQLVDSTYDLPVDFLTEAHWIQSYLKSNHQVTASLVRNGIRKDLYKPVGASVEKRDIKHPRILVEGHFGVSFKNTALAIRLAREAGASVIWLLTGSRVSKVPFVSRVFSRVPIAKTAEVYRSCDILLKLSTVEGMFGPPLEMFHCGGTSIVLNVTGHDEYMVDDANSLIVDRFDLPGVVSAVRSLLSDPIKLDRLKSGALETANAWPSWEQSSSEFGQWVLGCMHGNTVDRSSVESRIDAAWRAYEADESRRLSQLKTPNSAMNYISRLGGILPKPAEHKADNFLAAKEIFLGKRIAN